MLKCLGLFASEKGTEGTLSIGRVTSEPCKSVSACLPLQGGYIIEFQGDFKVVRDVAGLLKKGSE